MTRSKRIPDKTYLQTYLIYNKATGDFFWKPRLRGEFTSERIFKSWNSAYAGMKAGNWVKNKAGPFYRLDIQIKRERYAAHRLAVVMAGTDPEDLTGMEVDHINGNSEDNRAKNLRIVTKRENATNRFMSPSNTTGVTGVKWAARERLWQARISYFGKVVSLGYFKTIEDAAEARRAAKIDYGYTERHGVKAYGSEKSRFSGPESVREWRHHEDH